MLTIRDIRLFLVGIKILQLKFTEFPTLRFLFFFHIIECTFARKICGLVKII